MESTSSCLSDSDDYDGGVVTVQGYRSLFEQVDTLHSTESANQCSAKAVSRDSATKPDYSTAIFSTISLDGLTVQGYVDTGASHSTVSDELFMSFSDATKSTLRDSVPGQFISLGAKGHFIPRPGSAQVPVVYGDRHFTFKFDVGKPPSGIAVVIGRDLQSEVGISISGLMPPMASAAREPSPDVSPSLFDPDESNIHHSLNTHPSFLQAIDRNQSISSNTFCNLPEAVVNLETGDNPPVYRRQYPIPHSVHPVVDKQVNEWLANGKVVESPRGCQWNLPLLVALKKDSETGQRKPGRVCIDPRALNLLLQPDRYPLPLVSEIFQFLAGKAIFSALDLSRVSYNCLYTNHIDRNYRSRGPVVI